MAPCCDKADLSATGGHWNNRSPEMVVALLLLRSQEVLYPRWWSLCSTPRRFRAFQLLSFNFVKVALRNAKTNPRVKQASILPLDLGFVVLDLGFWRVNWNYYNSTILKTIVLLVISSSYVFSSATKESWKPAEKINYNLYNKRRRFRTEYVSR